MYTYLHTYMITHIYICTYIYKRARMHIRTHTYTHPHAPTHTCTHTQIYICIFIYIYRCKFVHTGISECTSLPHKRIYIYIYIYISMYTYVYRDLRVQAGQRHALHRPPFQRARRRSRRPRVHTSNAGLVCLFVVYLFR